MHQFSVSANDVNVSGGSINTLQKNTEALSEVSRETGLEINAEKTNFCLVNNIQEKGTIT
jgi:hypothetical protein